MALGDLQKIQPTVKFLTGQPVTIRRISPIVKIMSQSSSTDSTPPVVTVISPPEGLIPGGLSLASNTPVVFTVTDINPGIAFLRVRLRYGAGAQCTIHNGTSFENTDAGNFTESPNAKSSISDGFQFTIIPKGGWLSTGIAIEVDAVDSDGNIAI